MKKVRKSLALDVMDCQLGHSSKRKSMRPDVRLSMTVKPAHTSYVIHAGSTDAHSLLRLVVSPQEEPILVSLNSSSFGSKRRENILDQGFLLGPSDSAIFPTPVPPAPVSPHLLENVYKNKTKKRIMIHLMLIFSPRCPKSGRRLFVDKPKTSSS